MVYRETRQTGFTLIEVVVALAVAGVALAVLLQAVGGNASRSLLSREYVIATAFSESMLARVGRDIPLDAGTERGRMGRIFTWQRTILLYPVDQPVHEAAAAVVPYEIVVRIEWISGGRSHEFSLRSLRLRLEQGHAPS